MDLTAAELVVLGLVLERPRHGYDIDRTIEQRGIRRWTELAFSSIYYVLNRLEQRGLVQVERTPSEPRRRRLYSATANGRQLAIHEVEHILTVPTPAPSPLDVALSNAALIGSPRRRALLSERLQALDEQIAGVRAARGAQADIPEGAELVFSHTLAVLEAERAWLARVTSAGRPHSRSKRSAS